MSITRLPILSLAVPGTLVALWLVISEIRTAGFCPRLGSLPACYAVLAAFLLVDISCLVSDPSTGQKLFILGAAPGQMIAVWFSMKKMAGAGECPVLWKIPLCFASLAVFTVLIILRFLPA